MDLVKILIFLGVFVLLIVVGRLLSAASEVHAHELPHNGAGQPLVPSTLQPAPVDTSADQNEVLTGAEIGLPFSLPPVTCDEHGRFSRPYYSNYYFSQIDMVRGPADTRSFFDHFFLISEDPGTQHVWERKYIVATPAGLQELMGREQYLSVYLDEPVIIVSEWNLATILRTVIDEDLKRYGATTEDEEAAT